MATKGSPLYTGCPEVKSSGIIRWQDALEKSHQGTWRSVSSDKWWQMTAQWEQYHSAKYAIKSEGGADRPCHRRKDSWETSSNKLSGSANCIKLYQITRISMKHPYLSHEHFLWRASTCLGKSPDMLSIKKPRTPGMKTDSVTALLIHGWIDRTGICRIQSAASCSGEWSDGQPLQTMLDSRESFFWELDLQIHPWNCQTNAWLRFPASFVFD